MELLETGLISAMKQHKNKIPVFKLDWIRKSDQTSRTRTKCLFDLQIDEGCASHLCVEKANSTLSASKHFLQGMRKDN